MPWYRLSFPIRNEDLDQNLSSYRDRIQSALGKFVGRDATARVFALRDGESSEIYIDLTGRQPPSFLMRLILCEPCAVPPIETSLRLLGELRDGELRHAEASPGPEAPSGSLEPA